MKHLFSAMIDALRQESDTGTGSSGFRQSVLGRRKKYPSIPVFSFIIPVTFCLTLFILVGCDKLFPYSLDSSSMRAVLRYAPPHHFPQGWDSTDCNSPLHWDGDTLFMFNSFREIRRSKGRNLFRLGKVSTSTYDNKINGFRWIESTWKDEDGLLFAWYHNEPVEICPENDLTAPRIGAAVSRDNGRTFEDLGFIIKTRDTLNCEALNGFDAGGNGDFSVLPDSAREYFYFFFSVFAGSVGEQGVAVARMKYEDRASPVGRVWKWYDGGWNEPALYGVATPIFPAMIDWARSDADAFWGPAIHWNTYLNCYVILLNRAKGPTGFYQEGIYVTFNPDIGDPTGWTRPTRIYRDGYWYPQVVGIDSTKHETDKVAGRVARFFMHGYSEWEMVFLKPYEEL
jgi:hypothetical protein